MKFDPETLHAAFSAPKTRPWIAAAVGASVLVASLVNYLNYHHYHFLTPETVIVALVLVATAAAVALLYTVSGPIGRQFLEVLLVYIAIDINFDGPGVAIGTIVFVLALRRYVLQVFAILAPIALLTEVAVFALGGNPVLARSTQPETARNGPPALLHVILDEHIGIEGLDTGQPAFTALKADLLSFYAAHGFQLYGGAYSEYFHTANSIPQVLNFGAEQRWEPDHQDGLEEIDNTYFDRLTSLGYRLMVHQTGFLDYCADNKVHSCTTARVSDLGAVARTALPASDKAALILFDYMSLSDVVSTAAELYDRAVDHMTTAGVELPYITLGARRRTSSLSALAAADALIDDLRYARPGDAFFVHLLLPHYPYATNPDCTVKRIADWQMRRSPTASVAERQAGYADQIRCAVRKLDLALDAFAASPAGDSNIVVVHGDHGSRITETDPTVEALNQFSDDDLIAGYSTLFAVRSGNIPPRYISNRIPLARLIASLAKSAFRTVSSDLAPGFRHEVVLETNEWKPALKHPLPKSWLTD